jgi:hypothetical protein
MSEQVSIIKLLDYRNTCGQIQKINKGVKKKEHIEVS